MITRYCKKCKGRTPWNKVENYEDSPYMCEGCEDVKKKEELEK